MVRLLIADVTLLKAADLTAHIRFHGGTTRTLHLELPKPSWQLRRTPAAVVAEMDRLLEEHGDAEVARRLNARGMRSGWGHAFTQSIVRRIREQHQLKTRYERLRERGMLTLEEIAQRLNVAPGTVKIWRRAGLLHAHRYGDKPQHLFEPPGADAPIKYRHKGRRQALEAARRAS